MSFEVWLAYAFASGVILAIPGPTVLLVCSYALSSGRQAGWWMVAGVSLGDLVAMTASVIGLGALLLSSAELFTLLRWLGAAYLIFLGVKLWFAPTVLDASGGAAPATNGRRMAAHAFVVTATNPKSIVFFVAFVPQFIDKTAPLGPQMALMVATFVIMAAINTGLYVVLADRLRRRITRPSVIQWFNRVGGACLVGMGVATALARRA